MPLNDPPAPAGPVPDHKHSYEAIATVLNSLDALVYVADMQTYEVLFFNDYGRQVWGVPRQKKCYELLQKGQQHPCSFCTNSRLLNHEGQPAGVHVWEFKNTCNGRWYQCRDQAIRWTDGHLVRLEIATDITDRKRIEEQLAEARDRAERLADTDELTGLNNRRAFFRSGNLLLAQALRRRQPLAVIMFDLDRFKRINDRWGHAMGDEVLVRLARVAGETVRESDLLARLGGEEFAVLLPDTGEAQALQLAERLREAIAGIAVTTTEGEVCPSASLGVAMYEGAAGLTTLDELLNRADKACFEAKESGRNRLCLAS